MPSSRKVISFNLSCVLVVSVLLWGCSAAVGQTSTVQPAAKTPTAASTETPANKTDPALALEKSSTTFFVPSYLPPVFREHVKPPSDWSAVTDSETADLALNVGDENVVSRWVYAAVAPFPTVDDGLTAASLKAAWLGDKPADFFPTVILVYPDAARVFTDLWGKPDPGMVQVVSAEKLIDKAWEEESVLALIPFEAIEPRWKVLEVDGQSPLRKTFDSATYALSVPFSLTLRTGFELDPSWNPAEIFPSSNRDPQKLTTVILTGVTALVRGTADLMERKGMDYPAENIGEILREADITHVNNEIPFTHRCPPPFMREDNLVFCSKPEYIELLEAIGADVIELAGDHFQDWGDEAVYESIDLYNERGWKYYGGGLNLEDGRKALQMEVNGNKIAFIGCNAKPPGYAGARADRPGAVHCDFDWLKQEIGRVKAEGYVPIITFQHLEYYSYGPHPILQADFEEVASDGGAIVSGSQAHLPQAMEFFGSSFLHFGLGNLFFDQYKVGPPEREAFMDRHIIYDNRYINTELITIQFVDLAKPRLMTKEERRDLLQTVFEAGGW